MARQNFNKKENEIKETSQRFLKNFGIPSKYHDIVYLIFKNYVEAGWSTHRIPFNDIEKIDIGFSHESNFDLINSIGVEKFVKNSILLKKLLSKNNPIFTLKQLFQILNDYEEYFRDNKTQILERGISFHRFHQSPWLDFRLSTIYNSKGPNLVRYNESCESEFIYSYWPEKNFIRNESKFEQNIYLPPSKRSIIPKISKQNEIFIKKNRPMLLKIKIDVLHEIKNSLPSESLIDISFKILKKHLSIEQIQLFFLLDKLFMDCTVLDSGISNNNIRLHPGGISDILFLCAHIEKEKQIGTFDSTMKMLFKSFNVHEALSMFGTKSYFNYLSAAIDNCYIHHIDKIPLPGRNSIESIFEHFISKEEQENDFWIEFNQQINHSFKTLFFGTFSSDKDKSVELFQYSPDYRSVHYNGESFSFTPLQAHTVQILHKASINNTPEVGQANLLSEIESRSDRLIDLFKNHRAWKKLIISGSKKGTYRLKI
jgi:hypothetical protein